MGAPPWEENTALSLSVVLIFLPVIYVGMEPHEVYPFHMPGKLRCLPSGMKRGVQTRQGAVPARMSWENVFLIHLNVVLGPALSNELQRCSSAGIKDFFPNKLERG